MDENRIPELKFETESVPELTLEPEAPKVPELTLDTPAETAVQPVEQPKPEAGPDLSVLSPAAQKAVREFVDKIDLTNSAVVLQYGVGAQKNIAAFSESALNSVRTKDMGEVGGMLTDLVSELKGFDANAQPQKGQQQPRPPPHRWFLRFRLCRAPSRHFISRRGRRNTVGCPHRRRAPEVKGAR